jgi:hypothetical protein
VANKCIFTVTIMENLKYRGGIYPRLKNSIIQ